MSYHVDICVGSLLYLTKLENPSVSLKSKFDKSKQCLNDPKHSKDY